MSTAIVLRHWELSPARIGAGSATIVLHLVAFGLLLMPPRFWTEAPPPLAPERILMADIVESVKPEPIEVPPMPNPPPRPTPPTPRDTTQVILNHAAMPLPISMPIETPVTEPSTDASVMAIADRSAQLAVQSATPPPYPTRAVRLGLEGTVLLRVRVDEHGRAREVVIERSSGHSMLDRAATEHVLAKWRFMPAIVGGEAVTAWARVPVRFQIARS